MKSRYSPLTSLVAALLVLIAPHGGASAAASPDADSANLYKVEIILFRYTALGGGEDFRAPAEARGFNGRLDAPGTAPRVVRMLDNTELQMRSDAAALRANGGAQLLAHAGWLQTATAWPRHTGLPIEQTGISVPGLVGNLYLERGELLHFGADLRLGSEPTYALSELRKVRFNEKHYLDNPAFGLIVMVSPGR